MSYLICFALGLAAGIVGGFIAGLKNAKSAKVEKAKSILDVFKGR